MIEKLRNLRDIVHRCDSTRELADYVLKVYFNYEKPSFPINIFKMLNEFGIDYHFRELEGLEGLYSPEDPENGLVAVVAINSKRPYERQRFTAAHELCHHIKDYDCASYSPKNSRDPIEIQANQFASELLMPSYYFFIEARKYINEYGYVDVENALYLGQYFGTSFESTVRKLSYHNLLGFELTEDFFQNNRPSHFKEKLTLKDISDELIIDIIDSYSYIAQSSTSPLWYRVKNELIYHDGRIEGLEISRPKVAEIVTDLRIKSKKSSYYLEYQKDENIIETVGHSFVYDYLMNTENIPDRYEIHELHKKLFTLAPNGELAGRYRENDNRITGSAIETVRYDKIEEEMFLLEKDIMYLYREIKHLPYSQTLEKAVIIHHRFAQIHPYNDGNGRTSRAILNWILKLKDLPPVFVDYSSKQEYLDALALADKWNFDPLINFFMKRLLHCLISLNSEMNLSVCID